MRQNIREILTGGTNEVTVAFGIPRPLAEGDDRKAITRAAEADVRRMLVALNRGQPLPELTRASAASTTQNWLPSDRGAR